MRSGTRIAGSMWLLVLTIVIAVGCGGSKQVAESSSSPSSSQAAPTSSQASLSTATSATRGLRVASTLDGKTVLPHRIHWLALPTVRASQIDEIDFLIDGRLAWVEHKTPYAYADDGGYLVTSFLAPGEHRFTVRAQDRAGHIANDTVTARVLPAPEPPAALAGTWQRQIKNTSAAPSPGSSGNPTNTLTPPGAYKLTFERRWILDTFPCTNSPCTFVSETGAGGEVADDWTPGPSTFAVQGSVTFRVPKDTDRLAGWWCETWGPPATYAWSVKGSTLTLQPVGGHDACAIRGFVWAGQWTRAGQASSTHQ